MRSIAEVVEELVIGDPVLRQCIARGAANYSRIARQLRRQVSRELGREVSIDSIKMALIRLAQRMSAGEHPGDDVLRVLASSSIEVRTGVSILSLRLDALPRLYPLLPEIAPRARFFAVMHSVLAVTLAVDDTLVDRIVGEIGGDQILEMGRGYSAIVIVSPDDVMRVPGIIAYISNLLALNNINIVHIESCYTDTILIVDRHDMEKAFNLLMRHIEKARTLTGG